MGFVPLTLFFVACLYFQGNVMGSPTPATFSNNDLELWPKSCSKTFYCQKLIKPENYPSDKDMISMYLPNKEKYDLLLRTNATEDREGSQNICSESGPFSVEKVTMIVDEHDKIRYALYIPGMFEMSIASRICHEKANETLDWFYKNKGIVCKPNIQKFPYVVLTPDMKDLEIARIKAFSTACSPVKKSFKYMPVTIKYE